MDYDHLSRDLANEATAFIRKHQHDPFFLYFPLHQVHHPIRPAPQFDGTSEVGRYGDYIHDLDWSVGQVLETLDRQQLNENTLVLFTSDNGAYQMGQAVQSRPGLVASGNPGMDEDVPDESAFDFKRNAPWRGYKWGVELGGYRVPLLARWTGNIPAGRTSDALVCLTDCCRSSSRKPDTPRPRAVVPLPRLQCAAPAEPAQARAPGPDDCRPARTTHRR